MRVSVIPLYNHFLGNRLFHLCENFPDHWHLPQVELKQICFENDIEIHTWDTVPLESADVFLFFDPPRVKGVLEFLRNAFPKAIFLSVIYESPIVIGPHCFNKDNHDLFDGVLTYNDKLVDHIKYFPLRLPIAPFSSRDFFDSPFEQRRAAAMVNTNKYRGVFDLSRPWQIPEIGILKNGWKFTLQEYIASLRGDSFGERRRIARHAEKHLPGFLDVYGANWDGLSGGWFRKFFPEKPYVSARGVAKESKLDLLSRYRFTFCFENFASDVGYVSEKIFDALYSGSVPVYRGDKNIKKYVFPDSFIDASDFESYMELFQFLSSMGEKQWSAYREAALRYFESEEMKQFLPEAYGQYFVNALKEVYSRVAARR
jgi:alpha(1,3/1,4) fucosyltransferase